MNISVVIDGTEYEVSRGLDTWGAEAVRDACLDAARTAPIGGTAETLQSFGDAVAEALANGEAGDEEEEEQ